MDILGIVKLGVLCGVYFLVDGVGALSPEAIEGWENPTNKFREKDLVRDTEWVKSQTSALQKLCIHYTTFFIDKT